MCSDCHGNQRRPATEVGIREVGDDGGRRERGLIGSRELPGRAGGGSACPDEAVRAGLARNSSAAFKAVALPNLACSLARASSARKASIVAAPSAVITC